jgi:hypothetical protein
MERLFTILPNIDHADKLHEDVIAIWLDNTIGTSIESQWFNIARQLRQIISHVEVFTNAHECIDYVCSSGIAQIVLIVAGTYGDDFDMRIYEEIIHNVFIYILTSNKLDCTSNHASIRGCFNNTNTLVNQIRDDYKIYITKKVSDMNSVRMNNNGSTTHCVNPQLIQWKCWHLIIDFFRQMPCPREQCMDRLMQFCRSQLKNDSYDLNQFIKFQETYQTEHAIKWYTMNMNSSVSRLLYQSMRTNNLDAMMSFSHVLIDIYDQLHKLRSQKHNKSRTGLTVYGKQFMDIDEARNLCLNIGGYISNKTIFSTSLDSEYEEVFSGERSNTSNQSVLFEIFTNFASSVTKPFANLSSLSCCTDEKEVLFTNGHIFRIDSCEHFFFNVWLVKLTLCEDLHPIVQNSSDYFDIAVLQLLEILPKISPKPNKANDRLLQWWRLYCTDNPSEQAKVDLFEESYRSDSAVRWYTKDSLLYRLLNTALRHENIDMIIDFRYFIIDLYEQLTKSHLDYVKSFREQNLTVYRGQKISLMELRRLKHSIGNYISIKSLFSASLSSEVALCYAELDESDKQQFLQSVLFQIDIDMKKLAQSGKNHIFANIIEMSYFVDEDEVLFMANTQFRIRSVTDCNGRFWLVHLTLWSQDDENSDEIRIMNQYLNHLTNMITQNYSDSNSIRSFFERMIIKRSKIANS